MVKLYAFFNTMTQEYEKEWSLTSFISLVLYDLLKDLHICWGEVTLNYVIYVQFDMGRVKRIW